MVETDSPFRLIRSALFLPASNPRAIAKAREVACDMVILDLEDAVAEADKAMARDAAVAAVSEGFAGRIAAIRINGCGTPHHAGDVAALSASDAAAIVVPKVDRPGDLPPADKPVLAMIETPAGVANAAAIAATPEVAGLIAGTNDLSFALGIPFGSGREGLSMALQTIVLAARLAGIAAFDGVWNAIDDDAGLARECREGRAFGFDGKTLIHPGQIATANAVFAPGDSEIEDAQALIAAVTGGAARFRGRMVEDMHVAAARRLLARAAACGRTKSG